MSITDWVSIASDVTIAMAAAATATIAFVGLKQWHKEIAGRAEFEVARNLAKAAYGLRDALRASRSVWISIGEYPEGYDVVDRSVKESDALTHVYTNRWKPVATAIRDLDAQAYEAEALWGAEIRDATNELIACAGELHRAMQALINDKIGPSSGGYLGDDHELRNQMKSMAHSVHYDEDNELNKRINKAMAGIENLVRPHLPKHAS